MYYVSLINFQTFSAFSRQSSNILSQSEESDNNSVKNTNISKFLLHLHTPACQQPRSYLNRIKLGFL